MAFIIVMATISQIKAARLLLNWTQRDLARLSGLALATIANIEQGKGQCRPLTKQTLTDTFEKFGIDFLDDHGVDLRPEKFHVSIMHGEQGLFAVWEDYEKTLAADGGGEVLLCNLDHQFMYKKFKNKLKEVILRRPEINIRLRGLVKEGDTVRIWPNETFRAIPRKIFSGFTPVYVYKNKTAIVNYKESLRVVLIENDSITQSFRQQFEHLWKNGTTDFNPIYMNK